MIFQFYTYLKAQFPQINFIAEGEDPESEQDRVIVIERPGDPGGLGKFDGAIVQILSYGVDPATARNNANSIYDLLRERFDVTLPAHGQTGTNDIHATSIRALQRPYMFETDQTGVTLYGNNYEIKFQK